MLLLFYLLTKFKLIDHFWTGWFYKLYMGLLAVFCTNSINIHAGLNGLEVGQTVVIASAVSINSCKDFRMQIKKFAQSHTTYSGLDTHIYYNDATDFGA